MKIMRWAFLTVLAVTFFAAIPARAGMEEAGFGPRAIGMGQAQVGAANDFSAVWYNPACLTQARERWNLSGLGAWAQYGNSGYAPNLSLNDTDQEYPFTKATTVGALIPLGNRLTAGVNVYFPSDWSLVVLLGQGPRFTRYTQTQNPYVTIGFGFKVTKKLSIGYSVTDRLRWNLSTINLDLNSVLAAVGLSIGAPVAGVNPHMELDTLLSFNYQFGALYRPFKWISLGANYTYKNGTNIYAPIHLPAGLLPDTNLQLIVKANWRPTRWAFGVGLYPNKNITVAFDMVWDQWSKINDPFMVLKSDNPMFNFGDPVEYDLKDVWIPRVGLEYRGNLKGRLSRVEYALRAGYSYYPTPYPAMPTGTTFIDSDAQFLTGGFNIGYYPKRMIGYIGLDYYYEYISLADRSHKDLSRNPATIVSEGYVIYSGFALSVKI